MPPNPYPAKATSSAAKVFRGHGFTLNLPRRWQDKTIYTLTGPVENGIQHNVTINVEPEVTFDKVVDYAEWQVMSHEEKLKCCPLLKTEAIKFASLI